MKFSRIFLVTFAAAALVIALALWAGLEKTKGNHLVPTGKIGKVRILKIETGVGIAVIDFSLRNDSDRPLTVRTTTARLEMPDGSSTEGSSVSASDAAKLFSAQPSLGEQFNPVLKERDTVAPHEEVDRMIVARFDLPWEQMEKHRRISLTVEDTTGPTVTMVYPK